MEENFLDCTLVPAGVMVMVAYHVWLIYGVFRYPTRTVVGLNAINRRFWVRAMMEDVAKNGVLAVQTLRNNIMASTVLASTAIMLCSLIAILMSSAGHGFGEDHPSNFILGDKSQFGFSVKFFSILVCFLVSFLMNVQSIRYYSHASILINVPFKQMALYHHYNHLTTEYVAGVVNKGSYFWSMGLHAFYLSFPLFLWIFGPVPMFLSCVLLVLLLYFLDINFDCGWAADAPVSGDINYQNKDEEQGIEMSTGVA